MQPENLERHEQPNAWSSAEYGDRLAEAELLCSVGIDQDLARLARSQSLHTRGEVLHADTVGDHGMKIQLACFQ